MSNTITHKRLVSAFTKAGCEIKNRPKFHDDGKPSNNWVATNPKNGQHVEWHTQPAFVPAKDGKDSYYDESNPITMSVCMRSPDTDAMTDYFADSFYHTIKEAVRALVGKA